MTDKHDDQAKELLPCEGWRNDECRPAVAAALREKDVEIERLKIIIEKLREALADPPPDVQELVIKKLNDDAHISCIDCGQNITTLYVVGDSCEFCGGMLTGKT